MVRKVKTPQLVEQLQLQGSGYTRNHLQSGDFWIVSRGAMVHCYRISDAKLVWSYQAQSSVYQGEVIAGRLWLPSESGFLCLALSNGELLWQLPEFEGDVLAVSQNEMILVSKGDLQRLECRAVESGKLIWADDKLASARSCWAHDRYWILQLRDGELLCLSQQDQSIVWSNHLQQVIDNAGIHFCEYLGDCLVIHSGGELAALDIASNAVRWRFGLRDLSDLTALFAGGISVYCSVYQVCSDSDSVTYCYVLPGCVYQRLFRLRLSDGYLLEQFDMEDIPGLKIRALITADNDMFYAAAGNRLLNYDKRSHRVTYRYLDKNGAEFIGMHIAEGARTVTRDFETGRLHWFELPDLSPTTSAKQSEMALRSQFNCEQWQSLKELPLALYLLLIVTIGQRVDLADMMQAVKPQLQAMKKDQGPLVKALMTDLVAELKIALQKLVSLQPKFDHMIAIALTHLSICVDPGVAEGFKRTMLQFADESAAALSSNHEMRPELQRTLLSLHSVFDL
ncbi:PQQ-binding-like beta-propeller repeat protein [Corallincola spongiicola]|uniref:Uncharacterized protein n=1 Tax=Corallincola spongiicola TaxID=2520508 RepID=A0ABY1WLG9_9GAMM|nr:PQQ-binding-like beta-propeller repeat protein [Corallincola spongiicola]TAA41754.1 hypothetical protein EXY25_16060 [Corallincola spongiicola]